MALLSENGRSNTDMLQTLMLKVTNLEERNKKQEERQEIIDVKESLRSVDITPYFPISSVTLINEFMSNRDGNFQQRKDEFEGYLNSCSTLVFDMESFSAGLLRSLFKKNFIRDHRWPTSE